MALLFCSASPQLRAELPQKGEDILKDAKLTGASRHGNYISVKKGEEVASAKKFKPPVRITYVLKTDSTNIRLGYAADQIIFNWEQDQAQLRIDGGPADKRYKHGVGKVPAKKFVTIVQEVTPEKMTLSVEGVERASWEANFSGIDEQIRVFTGAATLTVKSIHVEKAE